MNKILIVVMLSAFVAPSFAQTDAPAPATVQVTPVEAASLVLPLLSGTAAQDAAAVIAVAPAAEAAIKALPSGKWAGKLDLTTTVALGTWQSLKSTDQAFGLSKRFWHLDKGDKTLVNVGLFAGVQKPVFTAPGSAPRFLGGSIIGVPGSTLDWALGTKWGEAWVPNLKTGVLFAHDLTRIAKTHLFGDFIGIGASYQFALGGQPPAAK